MPKGPVRFATCHPDRRHKAKGLCRACYERERGETKKATCHPDRPEQAKGLCGACYQREWKKANPEKFRARKRRPASCHPDRPVLAQNLCGTCYRRKWRKENPDRSKKIGRERYARLVKEPGFREAHAFRVRARRYGLTPGQLAELIEAQGERCAVCGSTERLHVDHCHQTGAIRGLLCNGCNSSAGHAGDDPIRLRRIAAYLERSALTT